MFQMTVADTVNLLNHIVRNTVDCDAQPLEVWLDLFGWGVEQVTREIPKALTVGQQTTPLGLRTSEILRMFTTAVGQVVFYGHATAWVSPLDRFEAEELVSCYFQLLHNQEVKDGTRESIVRAVMPCLGVDSDIFDGSLCDLSRCTHAVCRERRVSNHTA